MDEDELDCVVSMPSDVLAFIIIQYSTIKILRDGCVQLLREMIAAVTGEVPRTFHGLVGIFSALIFFCY